MCLKLYHTWTFSNSNAFRRMKNKVERPEYNRFSCSFAVVYVIKSYLWEKTKDLEERDRLSYKELKIFEKKGGILIEPFYFTGCNKKKFDKFLEQIPKDADVYGKVVLEKLRK